MKKPRVLVDCDGVLSDFVSVFAKKLAEVTDKKHEHVAEAWDIVEAWKIEKSHADEVFRRMGEPGIALSLPVLDGAKDGMANLQEVADVFIVTSPMRSMTWTRERELWLWDHFGIPTKRVIHTSAKYVIAGDYLIDDRPENVEQWERANVGRGFGVLWATRFNQHVKVARRLSDWDAVVRYVTA